MTFMASLAGDVVVMDCPVQMEFDEGTITTWRRNDGFPIPFDTRANLTCTNRTLVLRMAVSNFDTARYDCMVQEPTGRTYLGTVSLSVRGSCWWCFNNLFNKLKLLVLLENVSDNIQKYFFGHCRISC